MIKQEQIPDLLTQAYYVALGSRDPSTQNGALLVNSWNGQVLLSDYNKFPDGVKENIVRWERPLKYDIIVHSEIALLSKAASKGLCTTGLTLISPWHPCNECAKAIIQSKIKTVICHKQAIDRIHYSWAARFEIAALMMKEAEIEKIIYDGNLNFPREIRFHEELWKP